MLQIVVTLTDDSRGVIYNRNIFTIQATGAGLNSKKSIQTSYDQYFGWGSSEELFKRLPCLVKAIIAIYIDRLPILNQSHWAK